MRFELYGTARLRAGCGVFEIRADRLGSALVSLARECPSLDGEVIVGEAVRRSFLISLNGESFISDPETRLKDGDSLILISADAGG